ncbi:hypothetical protein Anapl_02687 [Anas platyrhynchos]|uniref:Uncharacterized protein n=1 Tax=Anas platyrhynchos TaxID=8839 RepID=R0L1Y6_ANAPL|nr:hypothetical protein Anapl_02687 [Anas platyrhynchos]
MRVEGSVRHGKHQRIRGMTGGCGRFGAILHSLFRNEALVLSRVSEWSLGLRAWSFDLCGTSVLEAKALKKGSEKTKQQVCSLRRELYKKYRTWKSPVHVKQEASGIHKEVSIAGSTNMLLKPGGFSLDNSCMAQCS